MLRRDEQEHAVRLPGLQRAPNVAKAMGPLDVP